MGNFETRLLEEPLSHGGPCACPECRKDFLEPTALLDERADEYMVGLECNNCGHAALNVFTDDSFEELEREVDKGQRQIYFDEQELIVQRFAGALSCAMPEDFRSTS